MKPQILVAQALPRQQRKTRGPKHTFHLRHRPYQIQPFMIAPVLPGETMTAAMLQARCKTDALASSVDLLGWWLEHFLFYVKLTDLDGRDDFTEMLMSFGHDLSSFNDAADVVTYHAGPGINWTQLCLDRVVDEYFRDEGDAGASLGGLPLAHVGYEGWLDSAKLESTTTTPDHEFPGQTAVVPDQYATAFANHFAQWEHMRALNLTQATFEDWIAAFGIKTDTQPDRKDYRPELLRYSREFQYPSVVVDGSTGSSTAAVVWSIAERADKRRLFKEPGFIFGVTVARPKVYLSKQVGAGVAMLNDAYAWLPAVLSDAPFTSLKWFDNSPATGPLGSGPSEPYWVDVRDLFIYGDQFVNFDISATPAGFVALPSSSMAKNYAAEAQINAFFAQPDEATARLVRQDGVCTLSILGMQSDQT